MDLESKYCYFYHSWDFVPYYSHAFYPMFVLILDIYYRLLLAKPNTELSSDPQSMPFILQRLEKDGALSKGPPGLEVK
jgi:hypothetical protein